jgi:hypothetical protein
MDIAPHALTDGEDAFARRGRIPWPLRSRNGRRRWSDVFRPNLADQLRELVGTLLVLSIGADQDLNPQHAKAKVLAAVSVFHEPCDAH